MDAAGDQDIKLQRSSPDRIAELRCSLPRFLRQSKFTQEGTSAVNRVRTLVLISRTDRLIKLLEPFQEWPQLLDPHLVDILQPLVSAFVEYLSNHTSKYLQDVDKPRSSNIIPLPRAVCKILYTLCKVRGQKVIVQFLDNGPRHLGPMLDALERWSQPADPRVGIPWTGQVMLWEERFIMLLWLSHLMLAPFDLVSMSSEHAGTENGTTIPLRIGFRKDTPTIAKRLVTVADSYLGFASREREAAAILLSRLALRSDMEKNGLQRTLIDSALMTLDGSHDEGTPLSIYAWIGILSFLARFIMSAGTQVIKPLLTPIFKSIQHARSEKSSFYKELKSSSVARKLIIKISRAIAVAGVEIDAKDPLSPSCVSDEALEEVIDQILMALADRDTSVRVAASKALSVIAVHLDFEMVSQIVEPIFERLREDMVWVDKDNGQTVGWKALAAEGIQSTSQLPESWRQVLDQVDPMSWHGLVLTLSQLLFRGSMPKHLIRSTLETLTLALHFEQRTSLRVSTGTNVRDAACFGLWSLARRYNGADLKASSESTFQDLAQGLVVAATLDSTGNIRRGASAALQELIGRHPGEIRYGIQLVQVVDYHAVALRSRAMLEVGPSASNVDKFEKSYWHALLNGLLDWRGVGSPDAESRHHAAQAIARLAISDMPRSATVTIKSLRDQLRQISSHNIEVRHGLILAVSEVVLAAVKACCKFCDQVAVSSKQTHDTAHLLGQTVKLWRVYRTDRPELKHVTEDAATQFSFIEPFLRSELMCEAICSLISALAWTTLMFSPSPEERHKLIPVGELHFSVKVLELSLQITKPHVVRVCAQTAERLFGLLDKQDQKALILKWTEQVRFVGPKSPARSKAGVTAALAAVFQQVHGLEALVPSTPRLHNYGSDEEIQLIPPWRALIINTLLTQINHPETSIELKCTTLRSLTSGILEFEVITAKLQHALKSCLNDYTINERGDVGSFVRIEAIEGVATVLRKSLLGLRDRQELAAKICGLAVEKLDKVRWRAWNCLQSNWGIFGLGPRPSTTITDPAETSTAAYFRQLISFCGDGWIRTPLLQGYITSGGAGSESVLQASRAAFVAYVNDCSSFHLGMYCTTLVDIVLNNRSNDRLVLPAMDFLGFLFDAGILPRLTIADFGWGGLFNTIQATHIKATNVRKIEAAVKIYAGMALVPEVKTIALKKLSQMLIHSYPKIRNVVADALFIVTQYEELLSVNWSKPQKDLEIVILRIKERLEAEERKRLLD